MGKFGTEFSKAFNSILGKGKRFAPELSLIFGIGAVIGGTVMACKATWDFKDDYVNAKDDMEMLEAENDHAEVPMSPEQMKVEQKKITKKLVVKAIKKYALPTAIEAAGIGLIGAGHGIQKGRYTKLASAYTILSGSYSRYRDRVKEKLGVDADNEFQYGLKKMVIEEETVDENGKKKKVKSEIMTSDYDGINGFAKYFDEASCFWKNDSEMNLAFLQMRESELNTRLQVSARPGQPGIILLNDVYDALDIPRTKEGSMWGWTYYSDGKNLNGGDNYISFGILNVWSEAKRRFVNGYEKNILLNFNVDPKPVANFYPPTKGEKK